MDDTEARSLSGDLLNLANSFLEEGREGDAEATFIRAARADETYFGPWLNLGLLYKRTGRWQNALDAFHRSRLRLTATASTVTYASLLWNVGITASIVSNWLDARRAWADLGYPVERELRSPPKLSIGRVLLVSAGELPWEAETLDPARCVSPETGLVVVRDAERIATILESGRSRPVFPILATLR